jgi:hypothetical protein
MPSSVAPKPTRTPRASASKRNQKPPTAGSPNVDLTSKRDASSQPMPHERDEAVGMTGGIPSERVQQGARDVRRGVKDTSRATEADAAYQKQK